MPKELDTYFGPKWHRDTATVVAQTAWPQAPERLRPLLDWFTGATDILPRTTSDKRYQVKAASGFYEEFGSNVKLAQEAYQVLREARYIVSSLDSLRNTARGLNIIDIDPDSEKAIQQYKKGWTFDE